MRILFPLLSISLLCSLASCTSPGSYLRDRGRDLADVVTIGVGVGLGAKARIGPLQTGLLADVPLAGLRGGQLHIGCDGEILPNTVDLQAIITGTEAFLHSWDDPTARARGKHFVAEGKAWPFVAFAQPPDGERTGMEWIEYKQTPPCPSYYTQLEVVVGCLGSLRLGVNPGELLDFLLGWTGFDLFQDDLERSATTQAIDLQALIDVPGSGPETAP